MFFRPSNPFPLIQKYVDLKKYKEIQGNTKITTDSMVSTSKRIENDDVFIIYPKLIKKL